MGCLNSNQNFKHWFGNIHLSGPCNRACYFCIGQHMMELDRFNNLDVFPLTNLDKFIEKCNLKGITEVNLTGSNTDPALYSPLTKLCNYLKERIPNCKIGVRTNGVRYRDQFYDSKGNTIDKISISVTSLNPNIYKKTMGGEIPIENIKDLVYGNPSGKIKFNIVLCPELLMINEAGKTDLMQTIERFSQLFKHKKIRVNVRQPYGQPRIPNPFEIMGLRPESYIFGNPSYILFDVPVTVWDVHFTEVESVNLYANGVVSESYPVTLGHHPVLGEVRGQENFEKSGRIREQWLTYSQR